MSYYFNATDRKFPVQSGRPVLITETEFQECCCRRDLLALMPYVSCQPAPPDVPYPTGPFILGPFSRDVIVYHETDVQCYYDDKFFGGIGSPFQELWGAWYGPLDGVRLETVLANPLPAGSSYYFTVVSTNTNIPYPEQMVGIQISPEGQPGSYARISWRNL